VENYQKYLDPQTLASLEGLDLQARLLVEGYVAGMHPSPYHGFSVEFAEHREYVPGDDIRHVDWKVWSKTDKLYLKQYEEETNLLLYLLLDSSESMAYASGQNVSKFKYSQFVVAALAYMVLQQQDSVGLTLFDSALRRYLRPASQPSQLKELIHLLDVTPRVTNPTWAPCSTTCRSDSRSVGWWPSSRIFLTILRGSSRGSSTSATAVTR
jgi:uncharacterized protein (DUF58 family)